MDAGGRATQDAQAENLSLYLINEEILPWGYSSTFLTTHEGKRSFLSSYLGHGIQIGALFLHRHQIFFSDSQSKRNRAGNKDRRVGTN